MRRRVLAAIEDTRRLATRTGSAELAGYLDEFEDLLVKLDEDWLIDMDDYDDTINEEEDQEP